MVQIEPLLVYLRIEQHYNRRYVVNQFFVVLVNLFLESIVCANRVGRQTAYCVLDCTSCVVAPDPVNPFKFDLELIRNSLVSVQELFRFKSVGDKWLDRCGQPCSKV